MSSFQDVDKLVRRIAGKYARRCWWADREELVQVGHLAVVEARRTFDETVGTPFEGYAQRAVVLSMRRYLWEQSAPVSGCSHRPEKLRGLTRLSTDAEAGSGDGVDSKMTVGDMLSDDGPLADEQLSSARWDRWVRNRLLKLASKDGLGPLVTVMLEEATVETVAVKYGLTGPAVAAKTLNVRRAARADAGLAKLLQHRAH